MPATPRQIEITQADLDNLVRARKQQHMGDALPLLDEEAGYPRIWDINDMGNRPQAQWLIENVVEEKGLCVLFGPDKVGKTAILSNFLWAWCAGRPYFLDERFKLNPAIEAEEVEDLPPRRVLYVLLEGRASFYARYDAWRQAYNEGTSVDGFYVMDEGMALFHDGMDWEDSGTWTPSAQKLRASIEKLRPHVLVIDTLSRATAGMNENSPQMAQVVGVLDQLRDAYDLTTVIVHHTALAEGDRPRGHSSLKGAASSYVSITGSPDEPVLQLRTGPHRNSDKYQKVPFTRRSVADAFVISKSAVKRNYKSSTYRQQLIKMVPCSVQEAAQEIYGSDSGDNVKKVYYLVKDTEHLAVDQGQVQLQ